MRVSRGDDDLRRAGAGSYRLGARSESGFPPVPPDARGVGEHDLLPLPGRVQVPGPWQGAGQVEDQDAGVVVVPAGGDPGI